MLRLSQIYILISHKFHFTAVQVYLEHHHRHLVNHHVRLLQVVTRFV